MLTSSAVALDLHLTLIMVSIGCSSLDSCTAGPGVDGAHYRDER